MARTSRWTPATSAKTLTPTKRRETTSGTKKSHSIIVVRLCHILAQEPCVSFVANFRSVGEKMKNILHCRIVGFNWYLYVRFFAVSKKEKEKRPRLA